ncbi:hypothetical protein GQR58_005738 [Nymphon striatum]|nr:hypothetical protein GQR58_005738 [Nymphon striatum]
MSESRREMQPSADLSRLNPCCPFGSRWKVKTVQVSSEVDNHQLTVCNQTNPKRCVTFDLSEFAKNVARIDHSQTIVGDLIFKKTLVVKGNITQTGTIDGVDLKLFYKHSVHEDGDEYVNGTFTITTNTTVVISGDLECDNINGVDLSAFVNRTLRINRDETVLSEKIFTEEVIVDGEVHADKFIVKGLINEVNITDLHKNALYFLAQRWLESGSYCVEVEAQDTSHMGGVLKFQDFAEIMYDLEVSGEINDIDLSEEAVTTNTQQVITGRKTMVNVDSYKHVDVTGTVNGYNLTELFADTLNTIENQTRATFENLTCETVNGKSTDTYVTLEGNQTVNSNLIFRNHTKFEEIYVEAHDRPNLSRVERLSSELLFGVRLLRRLIVPKGASSRIISGDLYAGSQRSTHVSDALSMTHNGTNS